MISACSKTVEKGSEKGEIDKITQKVAEDALHAIKDPIEQAKAVEGIVADRESSFEKNLGKEE